LDGRALAFGGTVGANFDTITVPTCSAGSSIIRVIKNVINNNGGLATADDFSTTISGVTTAVPTAAGAAFPGVDNVLTSTGAYSVDEGAHVGYAKTLSAGCSGTIVAGQIKTCTITNDDQLASLTLNKIVINNNNGHLSESNWTLTATGPTSISGPGATGSTDVVSNGSFLAGTYVLTESGDSTGYSASTWTCTKNGGSAVTGASVTIAPGEATVCTITNDDIAPSGGGPTPIVPLIGILKVPTPLALPNGSGSVTYNYTVWNVGKQRALVSVTVVDDKCGPVAYVSGDTNKNFKIEADEIWKYSCTATLTKTTTNTAVATGYSDDPYHQIAVATTIATVVVGVPAPLVAPLINVVKVPSRLTAFPFGGGDVVYTYTVTNPGVVAMHNITVTDDKCSPVTRVSGDTNGDGVFDTNETWTYTCQVNVPVTTKNIATAKGEANGFTAVGYAFADVLVMYESGQVPVIQLPVQVAPGFPKTGVPIQNNNVAVIISVIVLVATSLFGVYRLRKVAVNK